MARFHSVRMLLLQMSRDKTCFASMCRATYATLSGRFSGLLEERHLRTCESRHAGGQRADCSAEQLIDSVHVKSQRRVDTATRATLKHGQLSRHRHLLRSLRDASQVTRYSLLGIFESRYIAIQI